MCVLYCVQDLEHDDLLTRAARLAPVAAWEAAAAAANNAQHARILRANSSSVINTREGSSSPRGKAALQQHVGLLRDLGRKALRATVVAVHLLLQQQQQEQGNRVSSGSPDDMQVDAAGGASNALANTPGPVSVSPAVQQSSSLPPAPALFGSCADTAAGRRETLLHFLGLLLQEQVMCLGPWCEPWRFRPQRGQLRLLTLQAAQVRTVALGCFGGAG